MKDDMCIGVIISRLSENVKQLGCAAQNANSCFLALSPTLIKLLKDIKFSGEVNEHWNEILEGSCSVKVGLNRK